LLECNGKSGRLEFFLRLDYFNDIRQLGYLQHIHNLGAGPDYRQFAADSYLCTRSMAAVLHCNQLAAKQKAVIGLLQPNDEILESLETTGIDSLIRIFDTEDSIM
jgi:hypothetical protein